MKLLKILCVSGAVLLLLFQIMEAKQVSEIVSTQESA